MNAKDIETITQENIERPNSLQSIIKFARSKHSKQVDLSGHPYFLHLYRVASNVNITLKRIAYLHDILEDTNTIIEELKELGLESWEINVIEILTKKKQQSYEQYIELVKTNDNAIMIKLADLRDNMNITRLNELTEKDFKRLQKYHKAYKYLNEK